MLILTKQEILEQIKIDWDSIAKTGENIEELEKLSYMVSYINKLESATDLEEDKALSLNQLNYA